MKAFPAPDGRMTAYPRQFAMLLGCGLAVLSAAQPRAGGIKAGFAERDITPEIGMHEAHAVARTVFRTFHDPCKVRVAIFEDGRRKVALIGLDTLMVPRAVVVEARRAIEKTCGIPPDGVMIAASHSHSSGPVGIVMPGQFDDAPADVRRLAYEQSSIADLNYLQRLTREILEATRLANARCVPARLGFGFGHEDKVSFNRRQRMMNGQSWSHAGAMNPDITDYAGPIDPQVGVLGAWDEEGELLGVVVNFACHATTNPGGISANWPGAMEKVIQGALDTRAPVVFFAGASGDVTQVDNLSPFVRPDRKAWMRLLGGRIGAEVVKELLAMARGPEAVLDARQRIWEIKRRVPAPERVAQARRIVAAGKPAGDHTDWTFARETLMLDYIISVEPAVEVEVQAVQVGPAVFVSNPAEYFVQYGLDIKAGSPFPFTFPVSLANGCVRYVPTEEAFGPNGGGYETRLTFYSNLEITAGRQFAEAGIAMARQMTPGPTPESPKISRPGKPWPYGSVAPQRH
jgi:neutral ceramidase